MSNQRNSVSATAFPGSDAPCADPATRVENQLAGTLKLRDIIHVGCWNVRTLLSVGSQSVALYNLHQYRVDIACLSETRIPDNGMRRVKIPGKECSYWLYHSGPVDNSGQHGVALALSDRAHKALLSWEPISPRIAVARFKGSPVNITIIAVYAPTLATDEGLKDEFYELLQHTVNRMPRRDVLLIAGDWNARTGPADDSTRCTLGRFGVGQRCENGDRLVNFAGYNRLVVASTRFQHRKKHLLTWYSNDGHTASQIDHILISSRWVSSVEDCRAYRGAEAGNLGGSDHVLVRAKLKIHLSVRRAIRPGKRLDVTLLENPSSRITLIDALTTNLDSHPTTTSAESVEETWRRLKTATQQAASHTLGHTSKRQKDWISSTTIELAKCAAQARINKAPNARLLRRQTTRSARKDRNKYWSEMATEMEKAQAVGDISKLYRLIHRASCQPVQQPALRDSHGNFISDHEEKLQRWVEHFSALLNHPQERLPIPTDSLAPEYDSNCEPPTRAELTRVIQLLKNKKSAGEDGIPAEIYKQCLPAIISPLNDLFELIWATESVPADWGTSILLPIPKKGDRTECANYRGISLLDVTAKVFASLLVRRLREARELRVRPNQGGFRPGRGCADQIFTLRRVLEHRYRYRQPTTSCFIDFRAAFDSVQRETLWTILAADGVPAKLLSLMKAYYERTNARIRVYGEETPSFTLDTGVRQGCPLSPMLFNCVIDWIMHRALQDYPGVQLSRASWIADLDYADDIVVFSTTPSELQTVLDRISHYASMVGLAINAGKTKYFSTCFDVQPRPVVVDGEAITQVSEFKYLGSMILPTGQAKTEIINRINNARSTFIRLNNVLWRRTEISHSTKLRVYRATVRSILTYACETWPLRAEDSRRLEVFDHWCLRRILRVNWNDRVPNATVRRMCENTPRISTLIQRRRLQWFGHVLRKPETDLVKRVLHPPPLADWRCRVGGQLKTWISQVKSDVDRLGLHTVYGIRRWNTTWLEYCCQLATDRDVWMATVRDIIEADSSSPRRQST